MERQARIKRRNGVDATTGPPSSGEPLADLTSNLAEIARSLCATSGVTNTLGQVIVLAIHTVETCDFAGLVVRAGGIAFTPALSDPIVECVETLQHQAAEGPSLDALAQARMVYAEDLTSDLRWPQFGPRAAAQGIRSALALPLALPLASGGTDGVINLYAHGPAAFGEVDRAKGTMLAAVASMAVTAARSIEEGERRVENLHSALKSREVIGQAQGILMERERIAASQAFAILSRTSSYLNIKVREVAQRLVDTGKTPEVGPRNRRQGDTRRR
jgi:hypothetical protein